MKQIHELPRLEAPAPLPQSLAWDGTHLWMGSLETKRIYRIDPESGKTIWETEAPGTPYGMTFFDEELRVLCGETDDDNRFIRRLIPGHGFDTQFKLPCPDDTGSQLGYDGKELHVSQWYNKQIHTLGQGGQVKRTLASPHEICGQVFVDKNIYLATTDDEETNEYFLSRIDLSGNEARAEDLAIIPFPARALAFDGKRFWTNHRAAHQIVPFHL